MEKLSIRSGSLEESRRKEKGTAGKGGERSQLQNRLAARERLINRIIERLTLDQIKAILETLPIEFISVDERNCFHSL